MCYMCIKCILLYSQVKCEQYWPDNVNSQVSYGSIEVTMVECVQLADFTIRTFNIFKVHTICTLRFIHIKI